MIELDIDMSYCMGEPDLEGVILHDESGEHESVEFVPKIDYDEMRDATARRKERCIELEDENAKLREYAKWLEEWVLDRAFLTSEAEFELMMKRKELGIEAK